MRTTTTPTTIVKLLTLLLLFTGLSFVLTFRVQTNRVLGFSVHNEDRGDLAGSDGGKSGESAETRLFSLLHPEDHALRDATTQRLTWRVTSGLRRPDGVLKRVYLINDAFPGPTIEARSGDRLIIEVQNDLADNEGLSLHWHGLSMRGANDMDGAAGITQPSIAAGSAFVYDFAIEGSQHGSFWYHAHAGVQRADGLFGGLVVHKPAPPTLRASDLDTEHLLMVGGWYHRTAQEALGAYMHPGSFGLETVPDSMLVNGQGSYHCSDAGLARPVDCVDLASVRAPLLELDLGKHNVIRVVNVGAYAGFSVEISGARLIPLSVDGGHQVIGPASRTVGFVHPGERVSLLVDPDREFSAANDHLVLTFDTDTFKYQNPALRPTQEFPVHMHGTPRHPVKVAQSTEEAFDVQTVKSRQDQSGVLSVKADRTIVLYALTQMLVRLENEPHGFINHTFWKPQSPPLNALSRANWDRHQLVPLLEYDETDPLWVDVVLNNLDE